MVSKAAIVIGEVVLVVAVMVGLGVYVYPWKTIPPNFEAVEEGVLYRSGQPTAEDLQSLRDEHGIKTIVNVRTAKDQQKSGGISLAEERSMAEWLGMRFVNIPMRGKEPVDPNQVGAWMEIVRDQSNWPILVHCRTGAGRTGLQVAAYRLFAQDWSGDQAADEALSRGMKPEKYGHYLNYLRGCTPASCPVTSQPSTKP